MNPSPLPRAYLAGEVVSCGGFDGVLEEMAKPGWSPSRVPIDSAVLPSSLRGGLAEAGSITYGSVACEPVQCEYGREALTARVTVPAAGQSAGKAGREAGGKPAAGLLVFSEVWYPAWKAYVDGRRVPVLRAYGALRGVAVPAGSHTVRMIYDSWSFKIGLWLSIGLATVLGSFAASFAASFAVGFAVSFAASGAAALALRAATRS